MGEAPWSNPLVGITLDCADGPRWPSAYGKFLGRPVTACDRAGWVQLRNPSEELTLNIQADEWYEPSTWPERAGSQAKMMHFEVLVDDLEAAARFVVAAGGFEAPHHPRDRDGARLRVMLDPAGHPFCIFVHGE